MLKANHVFNLSFKINNYLIYIYIYKYIFILVK